MNSIGVPAEPRIYHIAHIDRLASIVADKYLWCDAEVIRRGLAGTNIGMSSIKQRRLRLKLDSYPDLCVGDCVPFYFCPRSVMLYVISRGEHPELDYDGGQEPILHFEAKLRVAVAWAQKCGRRWVFTLSNAGSTDSEKRCDLAQLGEINWAAVQARTWWRCKEEKQAEFLMEYNFPWRLMDRIGVFDHTIRRQVLEVLNRVSPRGHRPRVEVCRDWYY
ncbi:DUF4433 domain-containing protein [Chloracidobacterium thermophilum]|uniref:type II toxin-antitoxin system toxin DNA ADP-ribosyl transferase DarT n=1 Tax=Chloracidobacterium thermophilum TaxID=458033 RepID=UPI0009E7228A|nr:DUF4433 domain-containing protein [Chloracidobacterium thermophilum]